MAKGVKFLKRNNNNGWISLYFQTPENYDYHQLLAGLTGFINDDAFAVKRIASAVEDGTFYDRSEDYRNNDADLTRCPSLNDRQEIIALAGNSTLVNCPVQILLYPDSQNIKIQVREDYYEASGSQRFEELAQLLNTELTVK